MTLRLSVYFCLIWPTRRKLHEYRIWKQCKSVNDDYNYTNLVGYVDNNQVMQINKFND